MADEAKPDDVPTERIMLTAGSCVCHLFYALDCSTGSDSGPVSGYGATEQEAITAAGQAWSRHQDNNGQNRICRRQLYCNP